MCICLRKAVQRHARPIAGHSTILCKYSSLTSGMRDAVQLVHGKPIQQVDPVPLEWS
jgi:hypothetical protein